MRSRERWAVISNGGIYWNYRKSQHLFPCAHLRSAPTQITLLGYGFSGPISLSKASTGGPRLVQGSFVINLLIFSSLTIPKHTYLSSCIRQMWVLVFWWSLVRRSVLMKLLPVYTKFTSLGSSYIPDDLPMYHYTDTRILTHEPHFRSAAESTNGINCNFRTNAFPISRMPSLTRGLC